MEYKVTIRDSIDGLAERISVNIKEGWEPQGGMSPPVDFALALTKTRYAEADVTEEDVLKSAAWGGVNLTSDTRMAHQRGDDYPKAFEITITVKEL